MQKNDDHFAFSKIGSYSFMLGLFNSDRYAEKRCLHNMHVTAQNTVIQKNRIEKHLLLKLAYLMERTNILGGSLPSTFK